MEEKVFDLCVKLSSMRTPSVIESAKAVLVYNAKQKNAARVYKVLPPAVSRAVRKIKKINDMIREVYGY